MTEISTQRRGVRLSVFNHKGGVGKTTLTMNLAATLAEEGKRVLMVDSDPQCNLTSYLIEDDVVDRLLDEADSDKGRTIWSGVQPVAEALGGVKALSAIETGVRNLFLLPGDIRLSEFETDLAEFWAQCFQRKPKGFRGTTAISELVGQIVDKLKIDVVFFDSGPNIGPLNRTLLLDCDYFIVPVACDLFSLRALKTLGRTLTSWIGEWDTIADLAPEGMYLLPGRPKFLGYVPGGFRVYGDAVASQHSHYLSKIEREIHRGPLRTILGRRVPAVLSRLSDRDTGQPFDVHERALRDRLRLTNESHRRDPSADLGGGGVGWGGPLDQLPPQNRQCGMRRTAEGPGAGDLKCLEVGRFNIPDARR